MNFFSGVHVFTSLGYVTHFLCIFHCMIRHKGVILWNTFFSNTEQINIKNKSIESCFTEFFQSVSVLSSINGWVYGILLSFSSVSLVGIKGDCCLL